jgi:hypothetical protein
VILDGSFVGHKYTRDFRGHGEKKKHYHEKNESTISCRKTNINVVREMHYHYVKEMAHFQNINYKCS